MANKYEYLPAPQRGRNPFITNKCALTIGTDDRYLKPTNYMEMPHIYELRYLNVYLNCDATVANRYIKFWFNDQDGGRFLSCVSIAITANQTKYAGLLPIVYAQSGAGEYYEFTSYFQFRPGSIHLVGKDSYMCVSITNGQAGDQFYYWSGWKYLNHELGVRPVIEDNQIPTPTVVTPPPPAKGFPPARFD